MAKASQDLIAKLRTKLPPEAEEQLDELELMMKEMEAESEDPAVEGTPEEGDAPDEELPGEEEPIDPEAEAEPDPEPEPEPASKKKPKRKRKPKDEEESLPPFFQ